MLVHVNCMPIHLCMANIAAHLQLAEHEQWTKGASVRICLFYERFEMSKRKWVSCETQVDVGHYDTSHLMGHRHKLQSSVTIFARSGGEAVTRASRRLSCTCTRAQGLMHAGRALDPRGASLAVEAGK